MNPLHEERLARAALSQLAEPGSPRIRDLVGELGATRLHQALLDDRDPKGMRSDLALRLADADPERELDRAARLGVRFLIPGDDEWPANLDGLEHVRGPEDRGGLPLGLWVKGPLRLNEVVDALAVVGSRSCTSYGLDVAGQLSAEVARTGTCVVSGAAFGIDQAAHRGALAAEGRTVAVLACGVDRYYPEAHANLLKYLAEHGAVVSEVPLGWAPMRPRFLARNRLIAGLARGTVIVEAAARSGALSTANWTTQLNRPLMAVPGPVTNAESVGAHQIIRNGEATLVTQGAEVLELIKPSGEYLFEMPRGPERRRDSLSTRDAQVLEAVPVGSPAPIDSISRTAGIGLVEAGKALRRLAKEGFVNQSEQGWRLAREAGP